MMQGQTALRLEDPPANTPAKRIRRNTDPDTSHAAAKHAAMRSGSIKARLLDAYREVHPVGLTDAEAAQRIGITHWQATRRCADLRNEGRIERIGTAPGPSREAVMVCRFVEGAA